MPVCNRCYGLDIYQAQERIRWRLQPDQFGVWPYSLLIARYVVCRHVGSFYIVAAHNTLEDTVAATIEVIAGDQVVPGAEEAENGTFGGHTRGKGQTISSIFDGCHTLLQCAAGRVLCA